MRRLSGTPAVMSPDPGRFQLQRAAKLWENDTSPCSNGQRDLRSLRRSHREPLTPKVRPVAPDTRRAKRQVNSARASQ